jgi:lipopolysaccharide export LptBFGC system permease protein LptF
MRTLDRLSAAVIIAILFGGLYFGLTSWQGGLAHKEACATLYQQYTDSVIDSSVSGDTSERLGNTYTTFCSK